MEQSFNNLPTNASTKSSRSLKQQSGNVLYKIWRGFLPWLVPISSVILWQILSQAGVLSTKILPAPLDVFKVGIKLAQSGELVKHITISGTSRQSTTN